MGLKLSYDGPFLSTDGKKTEAGEGDFPKGKNKGLDWVGFSPFCLLSSPLLCVLKEMGFWKFCFPHPPLSAGSVSISFPHSFVLGAPAIATATTLRLETKKETSSADAIPKPFSSPWLPSLFPVFLFSPGANLEKKCAKRSRWVPCGSSIAGADLLPRIPAQMWCRRHLHWPIFWPQLTERRNCPEGFINFRVLDLSLTPMDFLKDEHSQRFIWTDNTVRRKNTRTLLQTSWRFGSTKSRYLNILWF